MSISTLALLAIQTRLSSGRLRVYGDPLLFAREIQNSRGKNAYTPRGIQSRAAKITELNISGIKVYRTEPAFQNTQDCIIYLHGGAHVFPIFPNQWRFIEKLSERVSCPVIIPELPLAPEQTYSDHVQFSLTLLQGLRNLLGTGFRYKLVGDSSGGGRALYTTIAATDANILPPDVIVLISPWLDVSVSQPQVLAAAKDDPWLRLEGLQLAGMLFGGSSYCHMPTIRLMASKIPAATCVHIYAGTNDLLFSDAERLAKAMKHQNKTFSFNVYQELFHDWVLEDIPEADTALSAIISSLSC